MKRAEAWDDPGRDDPGIASLKGLLRSARREDPEAGERIWRNLRPRLHALEDSPFSPASLWGALAAAGPRFALGAAFACLIAAGAFLSRPAALPGEGPRTQVAALAPPPALSEAPATPEEYPVQALQANSGDDLLQFIAYGAPPR
jgi:hypothetical protein